MWGTGQFRAGQFYWECVNIAGVERTHQEGKHTWYPTGLRAIKYGLRYKCQVNNWPLIVIIWQVFGVLLLDLLYQLFPSSFPSLLREAKSELFCWNNSSVGRPSSTQTSGILALISHPAAGTSFLNTHHCSWNHCLRACPPHPRTAWMQGMGRLLHVLCQEPRRPHHGLAVSTCPGCTIGTVPGTGRRVMNEEDKHPASWRMPASRGDNQIRRQGALHRNVWWWYLLYRRIQQEGSGQWAWEGTLWLKYNGEDNPLWRSARRPEVGERARESVRGMLVCWGKEWVRGKKKEHPLGLGAQSSAQLCALCPGALCWVRNSTWPGGGALALCCLLSGLESTTKKTPLCGADPQEIQESKSEQSWGRLQGK